MMLDLSPLRASRGFQLLYAARAASFLAFGVLGVAVSLQMYALTASSLQVAFLNAAVAGSMALALIVGG
ncbi:MFS transporter, partial [Methylobacterium sp. WL19]